MLLRARVTVPDRPGALLSMTKAIADAGGNIVDIEVLASADGRVTDDLLVEMPGTDRGTLTERLLAAGAEVLHVRSTVQISGQRRDLDLLARIAADPSDALASFIALAPAVWSADWAAAVNDSAAEAQATPGAPRPLPETMPEPIGPVPRRSSVRGTDGRAFEVVAVTWPSRGADRLYLGRSDGPVFLQVELVHLRRVVELVASLCGATAAVG